MVSQRDEMVDALQSEVLSEMADTFFGARCAVDDEVELFNERAADLHLAGQRALCLVVLLQDALLGRANAKAFWAALGVAPTFLDLLDGVEPCPHRGVSWALTLKGRYTRVLQNLYADTHKAFSDYLHGTAYRRPGDNSRGRLVGWNRYQRWAREINAHIDEVNTSHAPSCVLSVARTFDVGGEANAKAAGTAMEGYACSLDEHLALCHVDGSHAGVGPLPALPPLASADEVIRTFARRLCAEQPDGVRAFLKRLEEASR